jgi:hypothetical protein
MSPSITHHRQASQSGNALAILFFLMGMPNIYGALRSRSQARRSSIALPIKRVGLVSLASASLLSWLVL